MARKQVPGSRFPQGSLERTDVRAQLCTSDNLGLSQNDVEHRGCPNVPVCIVDHLLPKGLEPSLGGQVGDFLPARPINDVLLQLLQLTDLIRNPWVRKQQKNNNNNTLVECGGLSRDTVMSCDM